MNRSTQHQSYLAEGSLDLTMTEPAQFRVRYRRHLHYVRSGSQRHRSYKHRPERLLFLDRSSAIRAFIRAPKLHCCLDFISAPFPRHRLYTVLTGPNFGERITMVGGLMYLFLLGVPRETQRHFSCRHGRNNSAEHYSVARFAFKPNSSQQLIQEAPFYARSDGHQIEH
jgi:hypothetical protein